MEGAAHPETRGAGGVSRGAGDAPLSVLLHRDGEGSRLQVTPRATELGPSHGQGAVLGTAGR